MKLTLKRALALILCLMMCLTLLPAGIAGAEGDLPLEEITDEELIKILDETGEEEEIVIVGEEPEPVEPIGETGSNAGALGFSKIHIEPLYRSTVSEEQLAERLRGIAASAELMSLEENSVKYCSTVSAAGTYLRGQMVKRADEITFRVPEKLFYQNYDLVDTIYDKAVEHSDSRTGQQGDALRWGNIGWGCGWSYVYDSEYGDCYDFSYTFAWTTTAAQESALTSKVDSVMSSLSLSGKSERNKIKAIHDYICNNVDYDNEHVDMGADYPLQFSAYAAMCQGTAVCQGYAILFYRMAKEAGLGVRVVTSEDHAWNIVRIGSVYYNIDTTWDGQDSATYYTWYLKGMRDFNHYYHIREYPYYTDEFEAAYPMVTDPKLNLSNLTRSFTSVGGSTVSSKIVSKPKLLIFTACSPYSMYNSVLCDIFGYASGDLAIVVVDIYGDTLDEVKDCRSQVGGSAATFCYDEGSSASGAMWDYLNAVGFDSWPDYPVMFFIDSDNKIQDYRIGFQGGGNVAMWVEEYLGVSMSYAKPRIRYQPEDTTAFLDNYAYFSVEALSKDALSYQWYWRKNANDSWKKSTVDGCTGSYLGIEATEARNGYQYRCKVSNSAGYVYSSAATLTVQTKPVIDTQPKSQTVTVDTKTSFSVSAYNADTYQWYYRSSSSGSWAKTTLSGCQTPTLTVKATEARHGYQYRCKISNSKGYVYSNTVTLKVKPGFTVQPADAEASVGDTVKFTVTAAGSNLSYQWYYRKTQSSSWAKSTLSGATTATLKVSATSARNGYEYRCKISNSYGSAYSEPAMLTIGTVTYRALLVGEVSFYWDNATRNRGDVQNIRDMLYEVKGPKGGKYKVTCAYDLGSEALRESIQKAFAGADSNDVSLFFIATHGVVDVASGPYAGELCLVDKDGFEEFFLLSELADCLKAVPGKVIVLLGSCGSGAAIIQNGTLRFADDPSGRSDEVFTEAVIQAFAAADEETAVSNTGELRSSKFYVLTAAAHQESSWGYEYGGDMDGYNLFPLYFSQGAMGDKPADANGNGTITLNEMYNYVYENCYNAGPFYESGEYVYQHVQVYPENSSYALFK